MLNLKIVDLLINVFKQSTFCIPKKKNILMLISFTIPNIQNNFKKILKSNCQKRCKLKHELSINGVTF